MSAVRILIVGGVAGGASAATRARRMNESAEIILFEKGEHVSFANCGLPYHVAERIKERGKLLVMPERDFQERFRIDVRTRQEVRRIDRSARQVEVLDHRSGRRYTERYDKLILSPGAAPIVPPWENVKQPNVFTLRDLHDMDRIKAHVDSGGARRAVIIGAGFIGLEMLEALVDRGLTATVVEQQPHVLPPLDDDIVVGLENTLRSRGVELVLGATVTGIAAEGERAVGVRLADGRELPADLVLVSIGVRPSTALASEAGLAIGPTGGIAVNALMQTSDPDIYAVGDAAEVVHAVTGKPARIALAGPANRNGRLAGEHAVTGNARAAAPVAGTAIVGLFGTAAAITGLSVKAARREGIPCASAYAIRGHHAGYYPGAETMTLKLVYDPESRRILGAQAVGGAGVDKRIDVIATAIHFRGTIDDLAWLDLAYAPQFGSAKDPVHIAAFVAQNQADALVRQLGPGEPRPAGTLVDVRSEKEFASGSLPGAVNIPLPSLRKRLGEIPQTDSLTVFCQVGQRGYNAARILAQSGFQGVANLSGGYQMHKEGDGRPAQG